MVEWWKDNDAWFVIVVLAVTIGVCFATAWFVNNLYGLVLVLIELAVGVWFVKPRVFNLIEKYFEG